MTTKITEPMPPSREANLFFDAAADLMVNLYSRWQDECEYENLDDYTRPLADLGMQFKIRILRMTKRPFGCLFSVPDGREYSLTLNGRGRYGYRRIA